MSKDRYIKLVKDRMKEYDIAFKKDGLDSKAIDQLLCLILAELVSIDVHLQLILERAESEN